MPCTRTHRKLYVAEARYARQVCYLVEVALTYRLSAGRQYLLLLSLTANDRKHRERIQHTRCLQGGSRCWTPCTSLSHTLPFRCWYSHQACSALMTTRAWGQSCGVNVWIPSTPALMHRFVHPYPSIMVVFLTILADNLPYHAMC